MSTAYRRTLKGLRADHGGIRQHDAAKMLGLSTPAYNVIEQFVDDPSIADAIGNLYGVVIKVSITNAERADG